MQRWRRIRLMCNIYAIYAYTYYKFIPYDCLQCMCCAVLFSFHVLTNRSYYASKHGTRNERHTRVLDLLLLYVVRFYVTS